jgi:hypothetical protein
MIIMAHENLYDKWVRENDEWWEYGQDDVTEVGASDEALWGNEMEEDFASQLDVEPDDVWAEYQEYQAANWIDITEFCGIPAKKAERMQMEALSTKTQNRIIEAWIDHLEAG